MERKAAPLFRGYHMAGSGERPIQKNARTCSADSAALKLAQKRQHEVPCDPSSIGGVPPGPPRELMSVYTRALAGLPNHEQEQMMIEAKHPPLDNSDCNQVGYRGACNRKYNMNLTSSHNTERHGVLEDTGYGVVGGVEAHERAMHRKPNLEAYTVAPTSLNGAELAPPKLVMTRQNPEQFPRENKQIPVGMPLDDRNERHNAFVKKIMDMRDNRQEAADATLRNATCNNIPGQPQVHPIQAQVALRMLQTQAAYSKEPGPLNLRYHECLPEEMSGSEGGWDSIDATPERTAPTPHTLAALFAQVRPIPGERPLPPCIRGLCPPQTTQPGPSDV